MLPRLRKSWDAHWRHPHRSRRSHRMSRCRPRSRQPMPMFRRQPDGEHAMSDAPFPRSILVVAGAAIALSIVTAALGRMTGAATVLRRRHLSPPANCCSVTDPMAAWRCSMPPSTSTPIDDHCAGNQWLSARHDARTGASTVASGCQQGRSVPPDRLGRRPADAGRSDNRPRVEMEAFGITNEEVFAHLLTAKAGS